jgi:hypothetical protein
MLEPFRAGILRGSGLVWSGQGQDAACSACDQTLLSADVIYEFEWREHRYRFHAGCYGLWQGELIRRGLFRPR